MLTSEQKLEKAMVLLRRTGELFTDCAPDNNWWRDYFEITGEHMILVDETWETPEIMADYLAEDPDFEPDDEINAPQLKLRVSDSRAEVAQELINSLCRKPLAEKEKD